MRNSLFAAFALFALAVVRAEPRPQPAGEVYEGKVVAAAKTALTLVDLQGNNLAFIIGPDCKVTIDGKPATPERIGMGDAARIVAVKEAGKLLAKSVAVMTRE